MSVREVRVLPDTGSAQRAVLSGPQPERGRNWLVELSTASDHPNGQNRTENQNHYKTFAVPSDGNSG